MGATDSGEDGFEPDRFRETLGLGAFLFDFLTTHVLRAFRCLPPCGAATHLVRRAGDDCLRVVSCAEAREAAVIYEEEEEEEEEERAAAVRDG